MSAVQLLLAAAAYAPAPLPALHARPAVHRATLPVLVAETAEPEEDNNILDTVLGVLLPLGAGAAAYALHAPAFSEFAAQWQAISDSGVSGDDFTAPLTFWLFFAVMHPLLQPAIWISEVLHTSPGQPEYMLGLLPASFVAGNVVVLAALALLPKLRAAGLAAVIALFINYVGSGLDGTVNQAAYNLALDDGVKGCPTYEQVKQPSMDGFDVSKYTGLWYAAAEFGRAILRNSAHFLCNFPTPTKRPPQVRAGVPRLHAVLRGVRHDAQHRALA